MRALRIVRVSRVQGGESVRSLYAAEPLADQNYDRQLARILDEKIYYSDSFERAMRELGHEVRAIIGNVPPLERAWARENGVDWNREGASGILIAQLRSWKPDVVYFQDIFGFPHDLRRRLKDLVPSIRAVVVYKGSPGALQEIAGSDLVFAATPHLLKAFESVGVRSSLLYHAFDDSVWKEYPLRYPADAAESRRYPATFSGSSGYGWGLDFQSRYRTLRRILEKVPEFEAWLDERDSAKDWKSRAWFAAKSVLDASPNGALSWVAGSTTGSAALRNAAAQTLFWRQARNANRLQFPDEPFFLRPQAPVEPLRRLFPERCHAPVYGWELFRLLGRSRIAFNRHTDVTAGDAGNIRLFEATGMGACLVTERSRNIGDLFRDGSEIVTYACAEECVEKIRHLIAHPGEAERIAHAGQARTLKDHTVLARARQVDEALQKLIAQSPL